EYLSQMSSDLGVNVFLKREDMLDDFGSGHKLRKLEFLLSDAKKKEATTLISAGSTQSNLCRAVAIAGKRFGFNVHLVYTGDRQTIPEIPTGNYLLTNLLEPTISWFPNGGWYNVDKYLHT